MGDQIGGAPQQIAWSEELGALLILDDTRRLIAVTPGQAPRLLVVRDAGAWGSADAIEAAQGNLYVLDRAGDQVWRYLPTQDGFNSEREPLLAGVDLEDVIDLAVSDALYLLTEPGAVRRFQGGQELPFTQGGIDIPLLSPASLTPLPASGRLLVADRGNQRIVAFSADGLFRQQFVSADFADLRAIAVDERGGILYILVGNAIKRTALPPP